MTIDDITIFIVTTIAIILGPVIAVITSLTIEKIRMDRGRKLDIFRILMKTRAIPMHFEHVGALNLVEVEFRKHPSVIASWRNYLSSLSEPLPAIEDLPKHIEWRQRCDRMLAALISEIAKTLRIEIPQLEILERNYTPKGWHDEQFEQTLLRRGLIDLLSNKRALTVQPLGGSGTSSPFPPPPDA